MRTIGVMTVARSDYGIYRPILRQASADPRLDLRVFVAAAHLSPVHGTTVSEIEADGFPIAGRIEMDATSEPAEVSFALGLGVQGFARVFAATEPDLLVVLGDRLEMLAATLAALPFRIPLAHLHGGESSEGAFDESIRHAITKLSHLHFAATDIAARRIRELGEEAWRITVSGAPALDEIATLVPLPDEELAARVGMPLDRPTLVATFHPATLDLCNPGERAGELLAAVEASGLPAVFTLPNADPGSDAVRARIDEYARTHDNVRVVASLGSRAYFSLLRRVTAMVGNSSSGIIEAPSFELPVVNVGIRQGGRTRAANVIDVGDDRDAILAGIREAVSPKFRQSLAGLQNPYGDGHAAGRIVERLATVDLDQELLVKRFEERDG